MRAAKPEGLDDIIAFRAVALNMRTDADPRRAWGEMVTPNFFDVLGIRPALGRGFLPADAAAPDKEPVAVISDTCWRRWVGAGPQGIGRKLTINRRTFRMLRGSPG